MIDSHCHLDYLKQQDIGLLDDYIASFPEKQLLGCLCVSCRFDTFQEMTATVGSHDNIWFSVGNHPNEVFNEEPKLDDWLDLVDNNRVIAIGETGLDYHYDYVPHGIQQARFDQQIQVAKTYDLPLIIHCRDAFDDVYQMLKDHQPVRFVMHCFTGDWQQAQLFLDLGGMISFSGVVTFKNAKSNQLAASQVPLESMLIETDSPYLAPVPFRGKPNQPAYVLQVAKQIATLRHCDVTEVIQQTTANFQRFFNVKLPSGL